jgi:hypothetical protein
MKLIKKLEELEEGKSYEEYMIPEKEWIKVNIKPGFWKNSTRKVLMHPKTRKNISVQEFLQEKIDNKHLRYLENEIISSR